MNDIVAHLNETLAQTPIKQIQVLSPDDQAARIRVYLAPMQEFPNLAKRHGFRYESGNHGYFWTFWNGRHEIQRAFVFLATDRLTGTRLRHFTLEEITQSLGPSNDSPRLPDSIFYGKPGDGGAAQHLTDLDKKLVVFFYDHVRPGATPEEVRAALNAYWPKN